MTNYEKQADDFLQKSNSTIKITLVGKTVNKDWKETQQRNMYDVTITTPNGSMTFQFWDSINNTEISGMSLEDYSKRKFKCHYQYLTPGDQAKASKELRAAKEAAIPTAYDVLACLQKYDPGTFEDFCADFGYDEDSKSADKTYIAVMREFKQLEKIFTTEQMEELREIN